jgi:putative MFS transporter
MEAGQLGKRKAYGISSNKFVMSLQTKTRGGNNVTQNVSILNERLDNSPLTKNHYKILTSCVLGDMLEFFDLTIIAFVLAFIIKPWGLTYTSAAVIILSSGVGTIFGALFFGAMADRVGRRPIFMTTIIWLSVATGIMYFTPEGNWIFLVIFRFLCGFGVGGLYSVDLPLMQEFSPSKYRGRMSGLVTAFIPIGAMLASISAAFFTAYIGWRGLFLIGLLPALLALLIRVWVPESPRWLIQNKRFDEAAAAVDWVTLQHDDFSKNKDGKINWVNDIKPSGKVKTSELFKYPRSVAVTWISNFAQQSGYTCITMWGATLLAMVCGKTPAEAARLFIFVTLGGFIGRWFWAFMSDFLGRRKCGMIMGLGAAIVLILTIFSTKAFIGSIPVFWLGLIGIYFFADGGFAVVGPYAAEAWPSHLRTTGMGFAYGWGGIGKLIGPAAVAVFAGSANYIKPNATINAIPNTFLFLAACFVIMAVMFYFALETNRKTVEEIDDALNSSALTK